MMKTIGMCAFGVLGGVLLVLSGGGAGGGAQARTLWGEPVLVAQSEPKPAVAKTVALDEKSAGKTIVVKKGETVSIKLESNPTTGYNWRVGSVSTASVKQNGKVEYSPSPLPPGSGPLVGSGGHSVVKFDAISVGKATITLEYARPWEKNKVPAKTFTVILDVK
jgi:inhibitor of cysteine peptidase